MTVSSTANRAPSTGDGVTTAFPFSFRFLATTEIAVYLDGTLQASGYSVSSPGASGTVTFSTAPASGVSVVITRATALTQNTDYVANDAFSADSTEFAFDRAMLAAQDNAAAVARSLRAPNHAAAVDMSDFYGRGIYFDDDGNPTPSDVLTPAESYANGTWQTGRNAAGSADLNMWRINSANVLEPGSVISYDNTGTHTDRSAAFSQITYQNLAPTVIHPITYVVGVCKSDNSSSAVKGVSLGYYNCADDATVGPSTKGALYGVQFVVSPRADRNNTPYDDAVAAQFQNGGTHKATEITYWGRNAAIAGSEAYAAIGIDTWADCAIYASGTYNYGIDFKYSAAGATFTQAAVRVPNNVTAITGRNAANNANVAMLGINSSDQVTLNGRILHDWTTWVPTLSASSGTITTSAVTSARYVRINNVIHFTVSFTITTKGTAAGTLRFTLPVTTGANAYQTVFTGYKTATGGFVCGRIGASATTVNVNTINGGDPFSDSDVITLTGSYEV